MLEAKAELSLRPSFDLPRKDSTTVYDSSGDPASSSLAQQLMDIFQFEKPEDVIDGRIYFSFVG
jgi:sterol 3beta-glucosyltransferase